MRNVSIDYSQRLMMMREAEELSRRQFSDITGIPLNTIQKYETGHQPARAELVERVLQVERFKKYALWLMTGHSAAENGQVSPTPLVDDESEVASGLGAKFRLMREAEGMTRQEFADCVGLPYGTVTNYEARGKQVTEGALLKVTKHPKFKKYAYWLSTDETMPEVGQISPALSLDGSCDSDGDQVSTKTIQKLSR